MRLGDIGAAIQETLESYEVEIGGKTFQSKSSIYNKKKVGIVVLVICKALLVYLHENFQLFNL